MLYLVADVIWITDQISSQIVNQLTIITVSLGKGFGSKGKQHHKHTASQTHSHTQWSHQMQKTIMKYFRSGPGQALIPALSPVTSVYLELHGNEELSVTT